MIKYLLLFIFLTPFAFAESWELSDKRIPLKKITKRPSPILELGNPLLGTGKINKGIKLPTGAVWNPSLVIWGDLRTAFQTVDRNIDLDNNNLFEVTSRFDLFGNLSLTETERILIGFRPLDQNGSFTRYTFNSPNELEDDSFEDESNFDFITLFFEGDFGEIFPSLDSQDKYGLDLGFSVGRQQISWQDGMLINDRIDALGLSKINLKPSWAVNYRSTLLWSWNELNRNSLDFDDGDSSLYGWSNEIDFSASTVQLDFAYVDGNEFTGDGYYAGLGATQRIFGDVNSTFRALGSFSKGEETEHNSEGYLLFSELSKTVGSKHDFVYLNGFFGIDNFRSATRAPEFGGPLGATGILFSAVGLGRYGSALDNTSDDATGGALGYQMFFNHRKQNLIFELGGRYTKEDVGQKAVAGGLSFQTALGRRHVLRADAYGLYGSENTIDIEEGNSFGYGARFEWRVRF